MPNTTETQEVPPLPEWLSWDEEQTHDYLVDNATTCDCCGDVRFVYEPTFRSLPDFIIGNPELSGFQWVTVNINRGYRDGDVLLRLNWLDDGIVSTVYHCDAQYSAIDEYYDYICDDCADSRSDANYEAENNNEDESEFVHDYSYRPRTRFFTVTNGFIDNSLSAQLSELGAQNVLSPASYEGLNRVQVPYCGFELEMTRSGSRLTVDEAARALCDATDSFAYMKWDGSVEGGFELVTHPHTLEAYNLRDSLWTALDTLRSRGWRSWNSDSSCGLHVHINNASFATTGHAMRFLMFIYKNREPLVRFAGRDSRYARFEFDQFVQRQIHVGWNDDGTPRYEIGSVKDVVTKKQVNDNRYLAVNAQNAHTYELRFFRGNMNPAAVRGCLEFVYALHEYTQDLTSHDCLVNRALTWRPFLAFIRRKSADENFRYRRLYDRLTVAKRNGDNGFLDTSDYAE